MTHCIQNGIKTYPLILSPFVTRRSPPRDCEHALWEKSSLLLLYWNLIYIFPSQLNNSISTNHTNVKHHGVCFTHHHTPSCVRSETSSCVCWALSETACCLYWSSWVFNEFAFIAVSSRNEVSEYRGTIVYSKCTSKETYQHQEHASNMCPFAPLSSWSVALNQ